MKRRHFLLAILAVASSTRAAANGEARRFRVAFANLNEEPGTSIEGLGFSGVEIRRSFELASRSLPLDMIYYDNGGDAGKALANAADAVSRKVELLIEYNSDAAANAERVVFLADGAIVDELHAPTQSLILDRMARLEPGSART